MFDFDSAGFDGGLAGVLACAYPGARTPIGDTGNYNIELTLIGMSNINSLNKYMQGFFIHRFNYIFFGILFKMGHHNWM